MYVYHDNKTTNNYIDIQTYVSLDMCNIYIYTFILPCIIYLVYYCNIYIWATVNIWYITPSHQFLKSVLSFSTPLLNFQKIMMSPILLSINLNFGSSSYEPWSILTIWLMVIPFIIRILIMVIINPYEPLDD